jgi:hypothetical protein
MKPIAFTFAFALTASLAIAAPQKEAVQEATRRFERANQRYAEGHYEEALHLYQAAYDLVPSPDILFNIGITKEKLFDYEGCALALRQYLKDASAAARKDQAGERLAQCHARAQVPVKITSMPASAAIRVGLAGQPMALRGRTPQRLDLQPGTYQFEVGTPGYLSQTQEVTVEEGVHPELDFALEKLSAIHIEADVGGAEVLIDEQPAGVAPLEREVKAGVYRVRLAHVGYRSVEREVKVQPGDQVKLVVSLPPLPRERRLVLDTDRNLAAIVSLDGERLGTAPLDARVLAGAHRLDVVAPGHLPYSADLRIADERDLFLKIHLERGRTRTQNAIFGTLLGAAGALAIVGGAFGILALENQSSFDAHPTLALRDQALSNANACDALLGVAAGVALGGVIYYVATLPRKSKVIDR